VPRRIILIVIAVLISAGTFLLIQRWVHGPAGRQAATAAARGPVVPVIRVLVARTDLPQGIVLTAGSVRWQTWPSDDPPGLYLVEGKWRVQDVVGAVPRSNLNAGEPLTAAGLARPGERGAMAATLTPGYRAITVNVTPSTGMAGFVVPGDRVDLILAVTVAPRDKEGGATHHASETVLRDVRVVGLDQSLAEDAKIDKKGDKKESSPPKTATLEVTPRQAEIVAVAADLGTLSMSLRSLGRADGDGVPDAPPTHTWDSEAAPGLLGGPPTDRARRSPPPDPRSRVVVVRGDVVTEMMMPSHGLRAAAVIP
jgi:pilus assembly protein CpaB